MITTQQETPTQGARFSLWVNRAETTRPLQDVAIIARLTAQQLTALSREELIEIIRTAQLPALVCPRSDACLANYDRATLQLLAHLAQRCCRERPDLRN